MGKTRQIKERAKKTADRGPNGGVELLSTKRKPRTQIPPQATKIGARGQ